jgi:hypothetical protein
VRLGLFHKPLGWGPLPMQSLTPTPTLPLARVTMGGCRPLCPQLLPTLSGTSEGLISRIPEKRGETRVKSQGVNYPGGKMEVLARASPSKQQIFASDGVVRVFRSEVTLVGFETSLRFLRASQSAGLLQEAALSSGFHATGKVDTLQTSLAPPHGLCGVA